MADPQTPRQRSAVLATYALLAVIAFAVLTPNMPVGRVPEQDEGVFLYVAQVISSGGMPYRDVWDHKPPGIYLVNTVALALGGQWGIWVLQLAALIGAAWLSYRALVPLGRLAAAFGTFAWLMAVPDLLLLPDLQTSFAEYYGLPIQFAALFLWTRPGEKGPWRYAAIGVLAGVAALLKPSVLGIWIAIALIVIWTAARGGRPRELLSPLLVMAGGAAAVFAITIAWLASGRVLADAIDTVVGYSLAYSTLSAPVPPGSGVAGGIARMMPSGLPILATVGAIAAVRGPRAVVVSVALLALPFELALASTGRGYHYHLLSSLPVLGVLAAHLIAWISTRSARIARLGAVGVSLLIILSESVVVSFFLTVDKPSPVPNAVEYLRAHTTADDTVFIWGTRPEVLVLAERRSATRFVYQVGPLATRGYGSAARIEQLLVDLERSRPKLIVDASSQSSSTPPLDRSAFTAWPSDPVSAWPAETVRLFDYLEANYVRAGEIAGADWPVWRRRSP